MDDTLFRNITKIKEKYMTKDRDYVIVIDGEERCISGDTLIRTNRNTIGRQHTIKWMYNHFNGNPDNLKNFNKQWNLDAPTYVRSYDGHSIRLHKINNVVYSGKRKLVYLELENGYNLKATPDHKVLTNNGFIEIQKLDITKDFVMCDTPNSKASSNPEYVKVKSIIPLGVEDTYDIVCDEPYHNFVANGMVIHNSGKSTLAQQLGAYVYPQLSMEQIAMNPQEFITKVVATPHRSCIIYDEAFGGLSSRSSLSEINNLIVTLMTEMGQKNLFVIIVLPSIFMLDKYVAIWRARALFHTYFKNGKRGRFYVFNKNRKKLLYLKGKKDYNYNCVKSSFKGRFIDKYVVDENEYRKRKELILKMKDRNPRQERFKEQRNALLYCLYKEYSISMHGMERLCKKYDIQLKRSAIHDAIIQMSKSVDKEKEIRKELKERYGDTPKKVVAAMEKANKSSENEDM